MSLAFRPLHEALGVEVLGFDLAEPFAPADVEALRCAFDRHGLLLLRRPDVSAELHRAFALLFGPVREGQSHISNVEPDGYHPEWAMLFHSDYVFTDRPVRGISLYPLELAPGVAPTRFVNLAHAAARLPGDLRRRLEGLEIVHMISVAGDAPEDVRHREADLGGPGAPPALYPRAVRPVLAPHPRTGAPILQVSEQQASHFVGRSYAESDALLEEVFAHLHGDPANVYEHDWRMGDLVVWDNLMLVHGRRAAPAAVRRSFRRFTLTEWTLAEILDGVEFGEGRRGPKAEAIGVPPNAPAA